MSHQSPDPVRLWQLCPELMFTAHTGDGTMMSINPAWTNAMGWSETDLIGIRFHEVVHPDDHGRLTEHMSGAADGKAGLLDCRVRQKDGAYRCVSWSFTRHGEHQFGIGRDLTDGKTGRDSCAAAESLPLEQQIDAVAGFGGVIAHDFNNLLQGIAGSMELVRKLIQLGRHAESEKFIGTASSSMKRAVILTERLHAFSSRKPADPKPVEIDSMLAAMKDALTLSNTPATSVRMELSAGRSIVLCSGSQLGNAILDLVTNSREAMPEGGTIVIGTAHLAIGMNGDDSHPDLAPGQYVRITVKDTGTGMDDETSRQAFVPLFTTKPAGLATGLGLSMVYRFVRRLNGQVRICSAPGDGTTVTLYLPAYQPPGADAGIISPG